MPDPGQCLILANPRSWPIPDAGRPPKPASAQTATTCMTQFRPCIDLHEGQVKQIVGGSLRDGAGGQSNRPGDSDEKPEPRTGAAGPIENHVASQPAAWFASKYRDDGLEGGHVIKLGPGNDVAARQALAAYPGGLQIGGGINDQNAADWLDAGASHVIVTSWLFDPAGRLLTERLEQLRRAVGRQRIVLDLSCRRVQTADSRPTWIVAMNRWQTPTDLEVTTENLGRLAEFADEFLIHAADVEGLCRGIDGELVERLGKWSGLPMTYAGGVASMDDIDKIESASGGRIDVTVGSSLDLFGGTAVRYDDLVRRQRARRV